MQKEIEHVYHGVSRLKHHEILQNQFSIFFCASADGIKLPPVILIPRKTSLKNYIPTLQLSSFKVHIFISIKN